MTSGTRPRDTDPADHDPADHDPADHDPADHDPARGPMTSAQTSAVRKFKAPLCGRGREPLPETLRQTAGDRKLIARPVVDLPQKHGDVGDEGGGRIPRPERAGVKINRRPL